MAVFIQRKFLESISWAISISRWYLSRVNFHYSNTSLLNCISGDLNLGVVLEFLDFCMILVFEGKALGQEIWQYAVNGHIVLKLTKPLPKNAGFKIFADNYFTSIPLVAKLLKDGFFYVGTIRILHMWGCKLEREKTRKKKGRGSTDFKLLS